MRVLGIDPGLRRTGWGVVDVKPAKITHVANGICASTGADLTSTVRIAWPIVFTHQRAPTAVTQSFAILSCRAVGF